MSELWVTVHAERHRLADDLARLSPEQWATPSLCSDWDVHDVVAHLASGARQTRWGFISAMVRARLDFDCEVANGVAAQRRADPSDTLTAFRAVCDSTDTPPAPLITRIEEAVIHGEDIRRPLGIRHDYPVDWVARAVEHQTKDRLAGGRARVQGVTLCANDCGLRLGSGPLVHGPVLSLLLVASGRAAALADCAGPGTELLTQRLAG